MAIYEAGQVSDAGKYPLRATGSPGQKAEKS